MKKFTKFKGFLREETCPRGNSQAALILNEKFIWLDTEMNSSKYVTLNIWMPKYNPNNEFKNHRPGLKCTLALGAQNEISINMNHEETVDDLIDLFSGITAYLNSKKDCIYQVHNKQSNAYFEEIRRKIDGELKRHELYMTIKDKLNDDYFK